MMTQHRWPVILALLLVSMGARAEPEQAAPVTTKHYAELAIHPQLSAPATVESLNHSRISAEVTATVKEFPVQVGDRIKSGALMVQLDERDYRSALRRAQAELQGMQARLKFAQSQLKRIRTLKKSHSASEEMLNRRQSEVAVLKTEIQAQQTRIEEARRNLARCKLRAPFSALVAERFIGVGELVQPGTTVVRVLDMGQIEVSARLQVNDVASLLAAASIEFVGFGQHYPVRIRSVVEAIDSRQRNQEVRLRFIEARALPGTAGSLRWQRQGAHLPTHLLVRRGDRLGAFALEDDRARFIPLPGAEEGRPARTDLPADTRIIIDGRFSLTDGDPVIDTTE